MIEVLALAGAVTKIAGGISAAVKAKQMQLAKARKMLSAAVQEEKQSEGREALAKRKAPRPTASQPEKRKRIRSLTKTSRARMTPTSRARLTKA